MYLPAVTEVVPIRVEALLRSDTLGGEVRLHAGGAGLGRTIDHPRVQKSGLAFAGHLPGLDPRRVQVVGETELGYLAGLTPDALERNLRAYFDVGPSLTLVTRGADPPGPMVAHAERTGSPLAVASARSSAAIHAVHAVLDRLLAPSATKHGVLVEIHGLGTLLLGPSGIGKSECALFLVERGHALVADDHVVLRRPPSALGARVSVVGGPAPLLADHLEIRGLGVLDVRALYGFTAVREQAEIGLVVELCPWSDDEPYDRLGLDDAHCELLGVRVPLVRLPVRPGRELATLLEVAARNQILKARGHHAARAFATRLSAARGVPLVRGADRAVPPAAAGPAEASAEASDEASRQAGGARSPGER